VGGSRSRKLSRVCKCVRACVRACVCVHACVRVCIQYNILLPVCCLVHKYALLNMTCQQQYSKEQSGIALQVTYMCTWFQTHLLLLSLSAICSEIIQNQLSACRSRQMTLSQNLNFFAGKQTPTDSKDLPNSLKFLETMIIRT
jgi:hypothetical protein